MPVSDWRNRPCRDYCNNRPCDPIRCFGRVTSTWIGRGYENIPGKPFGYAFNREREEIEKHLKRRGRKHDHFTVTRIQQRIHKHKPSYRDVQQARNARMPVRTAPPSFTDDELRHLVDMFHGANDPVSATIADKAAVILAARSIN
jgi:hypothetical protein